MSHRTYQNMRDTDSGSESFLSTTNGKIALGVTAVVILGLVLFFMGLMNAKRQVVSLGNAVNTQGETVALTQDKMWKTLTQKAGITQQYSPKEQKEMLAEVVQGRTGGLFAKTVQENNPTFDTSMLRDLMNSVDTERTQFLRAQKKWVDLNRERNNWLQDPFYDRFLTAYQPIEIQTITSTRTREAVRTGVDDDVNLFPAKK